MIDNIFTPHFSTTPAMQSRLDDIERHRWLVEKMLLMPKHEAWLRREVSVRRAAATTSIEGAKMDEAAVSELLKRPPAGRLTEDERANLNAIMAYAFVDYLSEQADIPIDELVIRQLNREFLHGTAETLTPGVYRRGQNTVGAFQPPDQGDVPALMRSFALWLRSDDEMNPIIKAGLAHIHLVAVHPFWDGNGRTARGLATLLLQRSPFSFKKLLSFEQPMFEARDDYFTAVERTLGNRFRPDYDATPWLEFFTSVLMGHVRQLTGMLTDWHREMSEMYKRAETLGLNHRQVDGWLFAFRAGRMTRRDYVEVARTSPVTASRDLADLVRRGLLRAEGNTRARVYTPVILDEATPDSPP